MGAEQYRSSGAVGSSYDGWFTTKTTKTTKFLVDLVVKELEGTIAARSVRGLDQEIVMNDVRAKLRLIERNALR